MTRKVKGKMSFLHCAFGFWNWRTFHQFYNFHVFKENNLFPIVQYSWALVNRKWNKSNSQKWTNHHSSSWLRPFGSWYWHIRRFCAISLYFCIKSTMLPFYLFHCLWWSSTGALWPFPGLPKLSGSPLSPIQRYHLCFVGLRIRKWIKTKEK